MEKIYSNRQFDHKEIIEFQENQSALHTGHSKLITYIIQGDTPTCVISCSWDKEIRFWNIATMKCEAILKPDKEKLWYLSKHYCHTRKKYLLAVGTDQGAVVYEFYRNNENIVYKLVYCVAPQCTVDLIAINDNFLCFFPHGSKTCMVYNTRNGKLLHTLDETKLLKSKERNLIVDYCPTMQINHCFLVTSSVRGAELLIWDLRKGILLHRLSEPILPEFCDFYTRQDKYISCVSDIVITKDYTKIITAAFGGCLYEFNFDIE